MSGTHIIIGLIGFFIGGAFGVFAMALCAIAGQEEESDGHVSDSFRRTM